MVVAAAGAAMKLAQSMTFNPAKGRSAACMVSPPIGDRDSGAPFVRTMMTGMPISVRSAGQRGEADRASSINIVNHSTKQRLRETP